MSHNKRKVSDGEVENKSSVMQRVKLEDEHDVDFTELSEEAFLELEDSCFESEQVLKIKDMVDEYTITFRLTPKEALTCSMLTQGKKNALNKSFNNITALTTPLVTIETNEDYYNHYGLEYVSFFFCFFLIPFPFSTMFLLLFPSTMSSSALSLKNQPSLPAPHHHHHHLTHHTQELLGPPPGDQEAVGEGGRAAGDFSQHIFRETGWSDPQPPPCPPSDQEGQGSAPFPLFGLVSPSFGLHPEVQDQVLDAIRHLLSMVAGYKSFSDSSIITHIDREVHNKDVFVAGPVDPAVTALFMTPCDGLYR